MSKSKPEVAIIEERIIDKIHLIRGQKVMIDRDLAVLYEVETKRLKEAVRRNESRFPKDFMFEMNKKEFENWRTQNATSNFNDANRMGLRYAPFCFTEQGGNYAVMHIKQWQGYTGKHTDHQDIYKVTGNGISE